MEAAGGEGNIKTPPKAFINIFQYAKKLLNMSKCKNIFWGDNYYNTGKIKLEMCIY